MPGAQKRKSGKGGRGSKPGGTGGNQGNRDTDKTTKPGDEAKSTTLAQKTAPANKVFSPDKVNTKSSQGTLIQFPKRPDRTSAADKLSLTTNYFPVDIGSVEKLYLYTIQLDDKTARSKRRTRQALKIMLAHIDVFHKAATDFNHLLVSITPIPEGNTSTQVPIPYYEPHQKRAENAMNVNHPEAPWVKLDFLKELPLSPLRAYVSNPTANHAYVQKEEAVNAVNILLGRFANQYTTTVAVNNKIFNTVLPERNPVLPEPPRFEPLTGGLVAVGGFEKSTRCGLGGLFLNVNSTTSAFFEAGLLVAALIEAMGRNAIPGKALDSMLKGVMVETTHLNPKRVHAIWKIVRSDRGEKLLPSKVIFPVHDKKDTDKKAPSNKASSKKPSGKTDSNKETFTNVLAYFKENYSDQNIQDEGYVVDVGTSTRSIYYPAKVLKVLPGNRYKRLLSPNQQSNMIRAACRDADKNKEYIEDKGISLLTAKRVEPTFGIRVGLEMTPIEGWSFGAPNLGYNQAGSNKLKDVKPIKGAWNLDQLSLFSSNDTTKWTVIELAKDDRFYSNSEKDRFIGAMKDYSKTYCRFKESQYLQAPLEYGHIGYRGPLSNHHKRLHHALQYFKSKSVSLLVVMLSSNDIPDYALLKRLAEKDVGIHTTCVVHNRGGKSVVKRDAQTIANIFQKINMRTGGINVKQLKPTTSGRLFTPKTIVIGADVTHPGLASSQICPSIAAVVGSTEKEFNRYAASLSAQGSKVETIERFGEMVGERLELWKKRNKEYPDQIVIIRDGVSESQFQMVLRVEWPDIDQQIKKRYAGMKLPKVLLMCVLKRHGTRFFPTSKTPQDKKGNPHPGLVVDSLITYPDGYDWYLQSHACIQGTAKPAHYVVLVDDLKLPSDQVQKEIYEQCYLYGRCTRSIGIHPAARYADRACERGKHYFYGAFEAQDNSNTVVPTGAIWPHKDLVEEMYFV